MIDHTHIHTALHVKSNQTNSGAKALRKRWKALVQQEKENGRAAPPIPESGKKDAAATEEEEQKDDAMDPLSIGRRALRTTTWLGVYKVS